MSVPWTADRRSRCSAPLDGSALTPRSSGGARCDRPTHRTVSVYGVFASMCEEHAHAYAPILPGCVGESASPATRRALRESVVPQ